MAMITGREITPKMTVAQEAGRSGAHFSSNSQPPRFGIYFSLSSYFQGHTGVVGDMPGHSAFGRYGTLSSRTRRLIPRVAAAS